MGAALTLSSVMGANAQANAELHFEEEQYQKALWMTTRFYGAQRMGDGVNWLVADHEPNGVQNGQGFDKSKFVKGKSYLKDADGSYDLTGGWFDCGDFVLFGQTFYYSAYMLILGYSEFPEGYDDYYSFDYTGYVNSGDYTWEGKKGVPNGIPDILDEVKYATDFILKAVRDNKTFYYQKGDGDADHRVWCTSTVKSAMPKSNGGESDGSRPVLKASGNVTSMASFAGATLAAMSRLYRKFDPEYANKCLEKAKVAYEFVTTTSKGNTEAPTYYPDKKPKYITDMVTFFVELYRATGDETYLKAAEENCGWMAAEKDYNYNYALCYANTDDLAAYLVASLGDKSSYSKQARKVMDFYANSMYKPASGYMLNTKGGGWGALRYPCNMAFSHALYWKLTGETSIIDPYTLTTIEFVMGENPSKRSLIVGFGKDYPVIPHHRNFFRYDGNNMNAIPIPNSSYKFIQLGFMVGGNGTTVQSGAYTESLENYQSSEGGIDYQAGLVGALGYLNSVIKPVNTNKFGHPTPNFEATISICGLSSVTLDSKVKSDGRKTFTWYKDGVKVESSTSATTYEATSAGTYVCEIDSAGEWNTNGTVDVVAELPFEDKTEELVLCDPAKYVFKVERPLFDNQLGIPLTYQWYKNGVAIDNGNSTTFEITKPGIYECELSAKNCPSRIYKVEVTSLLPEVEDAVSDASGTVTMKVLSDGEYEWYDVEDGGTPLHTGTSFTTTITKDTEFFVQDAGTMSTVVGPNSKTFTSKPTSGGDIAAKFTAEKSLSITGVTIEVQQVYYNDGQAKSAVAELSYNGKKTTFTSKAISSPGEGKHEFDFSDDPIVINEEGDYTITFKIDNRALTFYDGGPAYSTYVGNGNPITFTGATNGQNNPFPGYFDWKVTTGSGCARAVVKATKGNASSVDQDESMATICETYPNPCKDILHINLSCNENVSGNIQVDFINLLGDVVKAIETQADNLNSGINVSDLLPGIYVVRATDGEKTMVKRIVKE